MAEADGNRTRRGLNQPPTGFEDRGTHQASGRLPDVVAKSRLARMSRTFQVVFDAADPGALADFWSEALGFVRQDPPAGFSSWEAWAAGQDIPASDWNKYDALIDPDGSGRRVFFQKVPEPKTAKNRCHLDIRVADRGMAPEQAMEMIEAEASRLVQLGATRGESYTELGSQWIVMQDPEGNEFCVT